MDESRKYCVTYICSSCDHKDKEAYDSLDLALDASWPVCKACGKTIFRRTYEGYEEKKPAKTRTIGCDEAISEIAEILTQNSGEWIADIYHKVSGKTAVYEEDNITITDKEVEEEKEDSENEKT